MSMMLGLFDMQDVNLATSPDDRAVRRLASAMWGACTMRVDGDRTHIIDASGTVRGYIAGARGSKRPAKPIVKELATDLAELPAKHGDMDSEVDEDEEEDDDDGDAEEHDEQDLELEESPDEN